MEIWLDAIQLDVVQKAARQGVLSGVTTNPSILSKASNPLKMVSQLLDVQSGPVAVQVTSRSAQEMIQEGLALFETSNRIIVKIPVNSNGLVAIHHLSQAGVTTLGTSVCDPLQALLAAKAGASYVAPYLGRMLDAEMDAWKELEEMVTIFQNQLISTQILVASIRDLSHVTRCARMGIDAITLKEAMYEKLVEGNPLSEQWTDELLQEWYSLQT